MSKDYEWSIDTVAARLAETEDRLAQDDPQLKSVFTQTFFEEAKAQIPGLGGSPRSALAGAILSIKDLLDVRGFVTRAGTKFMQADAPAAEDAVIVGKLREAGAVLIGHTNMTELAYSGLGLNPHYGTPENAIFEGCIPGGSTSGGAVSVAQGAADIAIGTDTGGSLRIPAAFNGIVGFKPTQSSVSRDGCKALSRSLDSVGPMARSVAACDLAYRVLAGENAGGEPLSDADFVIPANYGMDDLEPAVADALEAAIGRLTAAGFAVREAKIDALEQLKALPIWHFASVECRAEYDHAYRNHRDLIDPRIAGPTRMGRADEVDAVTYRKTLNRRADLIGLFRREMAGRVLLMPTVPILPPRFEALEDDEAYSRINLQVLRNPSIANVMDCCSISVPYAGGAAPMGIMMTACGGRDRALLSLAAKVEASFDLQG